MEEPSLLKSIFAGLESVSTLPPSLPSVHTVDGARTTAFSRRSHQTAPACLRGTDDTGVFSLAS